MPLLAADPVTVLPEQRKALEHLVRTHSTPQQLALRARIVVQAADGIAVRASARELGVWPKTVRYWRRRWREAGGQAVGPRAAGRCAAHGSAGDVHARADLRSGRDDMREAVGERAAHQPLEPARDCRRSHATRPHPEHLAALGGAFFKKLLREVVWVILDQFRTAVFFCCCRCGHVGNALALSIISTALPAARAVDL